VATTTVQLNQVLAVEKGVKATAASELAAAQQALANSARLSGISRTYRPRDEEGEALPAESTRVQVRAKDILTGLRSALSRLFDVTLTKDVTNGTAKADVFVDGQLIAAAVPATTLIFLEKQLAEFAAFVARLPVLDPSETWTYDDTSDAFRTITTETARAKKIPRNHVLAEATEKHPAQVQVYMEDIVAGYWATTKFSGALPQKDVTALAQRVAKLAEAVKVAREQANTAAVADAKIGEAVFSYLLG
jgi:hypothetical protein